MRFMAAALILGLVYPATAQVPPGVPITGPKGDTRPGPVCAWFAQKAGHDVYGYYERVVRVAPRILVGVKLQDGRRVNCVMLLGIDEFKLIQLTQPFTPGSEERKCCARPSLSQRSCAASG